LILNINDENTLILHVPSSSLKVPSMSRAYQISRELLADDLAAFETRLSAVLKQQESYLSDTELELYRRGKRLRPILLMLGARMCGHPDGEPFSDRIVCAAVSVEMTHVGSLIHDDIVDMASLRRGLPTVNAARGNELALLIGDLQLIDSLRVFSRHINDTRDLRLMRDYLDAGFSVCKGQIDEILSEPTWEEESMLRRYFRTIDRKTGQLIAFSCEGGARLVTQDYGSIASLARFGRLLGRAFQIVDDVLDVLQSTPDAGKALLTDLAQRRLTLPIIYALRGLPPEHPLQRHVRGAPCTAAETAEAGRALRRSPGVVQAYSEARDLVFAALRVLHRFQPGPYRDALEALATESVDRDFRAAPLAAAAGRARPAPATSRLPHRTRPTVPHPVTRRTKGKRRRRKYGRDRPHVR
jgi:heptaprenyl diphosphate synthase